MNNRQLSTKTTQILFDMQNNEITEYHIYQKIAARVKNKKNKDILLTIANEEKKHALIWQQYTGQASLPSRWKIFYYQLLALLFGYTFALKLMESGEAAAASNYEGLVAEIPEAQQIAADENLHEQQLLTILDEERLRYVGSMVLGLNDALVELTGTLAGLTLALQNTKLIALSGLITGVSATLSMASSEFLSARSEDRSDALKSALYTGIAYCLTVTLLVLPYLIFDNEHYLYALLTMLLIVVLIIACFTYYIAVAKTLSFQKRFSEMAIISLSVAAFAFIVGLLVKELLGIDI
ncbi:MAG TPA: VIT1/CCC1 transporter family protein [Candidatus Avacidaminococcus intestinavium]|uniref:VIT1/CCC1 transporter family protein n=1 Tax=Candidatus Avacidaminococcus intestinavium TaxID=2840684 RepID=A0A9D1SLT1_9FIRM|nr:VIT1/CCC1 transporter family protein [Candidatus Avacidaminococcus intestinavium]